MNYTNIFRVESSEKNLFGKMSTIYTAFDRDGNKVPAKLLPKPIRQQAFDTTQCIAVNNDGNLELVDASPIAAAIRPLRSAFKPLGSLSITAPSKKHSIIPPAI